MAGRGRSLLGHFVKYANFALGVTKCTKEDEVPKCSLFFLCSEMADKKTVLESVPSDFSAILAGKGKQGR